MVRKDAAAPAGPGGKEPPPALYANLGRMPNRPLDLPIYGQAFMQSESL